MGCENNELTSLTKSGSVALAAINCSNNQLTSLDVSTIGDNIDCSSNQFTAVALNNIFSTLRYLKDPYGNYITIKGNPGTFDCDKSIAEKKGWIVFDE